MMKVTVLYTVGITVLSLWLVVGAETAKAQTVSVWLTTDDQSTELQPQASVTFAPGSDASNPVIVDETQAYQQVEGFGADFTDSAAYLLNEVATPAARSNAMNSLFTRTGGGIGVSFVRDPMGASDLARSQYSYDDLPAGQTDTNLTFFSIAHDQVDIIPLVLQALQLNPQLTIMANPWSPPGWMKDSGSMVGGSLLPGMYTPFAQYFVKYIQAYQAAGIPIHYISLQNEPLYQPGDYPGMYMDATTQLSVLRDYVLPVLASNNITTRVLVYDHNWDQPGYPETVLSDTNVLASGQVAGTAWHGYAGTPGAMLTLAGLYPTKGNYETEHSGGTWVSDQVQADFEEIIQVMRSWGRSYVKWSLALDENDGPHDGGCSTCTPLVTVNSSSGALSYDIEFYTLGHFSKFVLPGAYRIYSANGAGVINAAFVNPDGSKVLVAFNDSSSSQTFQVQWGNQSFTYTLASLAGATFTWTGTQTGGYTVDPTNQIQASSFNAVSGLETEPTTDTLGGYDLGYASNGSYAVYQNVDFAAGVANVTARVASAGSGGTLTFLLDSPTGPLISSVTIPITGGWQTWSNMGASVSGASGLHNLYVVFNGSSGGIGNLNWFQFSGALQPVPPAAPTGLTATPGDAAVALTWNTSSNAVNYNVKRSTVGGGPYTTIATSSTTSYTDTGLVNCASYYYVVSGTNSYGESADSTAAAVTLGPYYFAVNSGGSTAGTFDADEDVAGGTEASTSVAINTSNITNGAPQAVYQTERYGNFTYTFSGLTTGVNYTVRLHFAEIYWDAAGDRLFNVSINGTQVLSNFDVFAVAGGENIANVQQFSATANGSNQIVIVYTTIKDNAKSSGIEIILPAPVAPTGLTATATVGQVTLNWSAVSGAGGYIVQRSTVSGGPYTNLANGVTSTTYTDASVTNGSPYYYVVSSLENGCEGANSAEVNATPLSAFAQWQIQYFGSTTNPSAAANIDADGTGQNNQFKYAAGLDPTNPASVFQVLKVAPQGKDLMITWATAGIRTNAVQTCSGDGNGGYTTNFGDASGPIVINVSGDATTNWTDIGGATNGPARYYRIRLVP